MFFMKKKQQHGKTVDKEYIRNQIELQNIRDEAKHEIRTLRQEMNDLIQRATTADAEERQLLSVEYEEKEASLADAMTNFNDTCKLITRFNGINQAQQRQATAEKILTISESIDTDKLIRDGNRLKARRDMMEDESAKLDTLLAESRVTSSAMPVNSDFEAKVRAAQRQKLAAVTSEKIISPSRVAMAAVNN